MVRKSLLENSTNNLASVGDGNKVAEEEERESGQTLL